MGRPKKAAPKFVEPEDESQDPEDLEAQQRVEEAEPEADQAKVSKTDAIRAALAEGADSPEDGTDFIRKRFGIEISRQHFSATKSQIRKKEAAGGGDAAPKAKRASRAEKAETPAPQATPSAPPIAQSAATSPDMIGDLAAVKALVKRLGAEQVKQIADLFGD